MTSCTFATWPPIFEAYTDQPAPPAELVCQVEAISEEVTKEELMSSLKQWRLYDTTLDDL
jgi:hypothetical protein